MRLVLADRAVVVTGAGRGLGRAYALHAARSGAAVVVNDIDAAASERVAREIRAFGGIGVSSGHSVADADAAVELIDLCVRSFGAIDGLVNNAGLFHQADPWAEELDRVRALVEVNVMGTLHCGLAAIARMRERRRAGSVVNVTSGTHLGFPGSAVYGATKGAVASLTYGWALDLLGSGIRVNAISPLAVTDMKLPPYEGHAGPDEIAPLVTFLLSERAAGITGQIVRRDRRRLGLIRHPAIGAMVEFPAAAETTGDPPGDAAWEVDDIDRAFRESLRELEPIGYGEHRVHPAVTDGGP